ncbi:hypothetical protein ABPG72_004152 [Tetrahymena utriculariae]
MNNVIYTLNINYINFHYDYNRSKQQNIYSPFVLATLQFSHLINQNPTLTPQNQSKIVFQSSRSQFAPYNYIFKSNTINSQATKKSKVQFSIKVFLNNKKALLKGELQKRKELYQKVQKRLIQGACVNKKQARAIKKVLKTIQKMLITLFNKEVQ